MKRLIGSGGQSGAPAAHIGSSVIRNGVDKDLFAARPPARTNSVENYDHARHGVPAETTKFYKLIHVDINH